MHHNGIDAFIDYSSSLYIRNGTPTEVVIIDPTGFVGIGVVTPSAKLDVNGIIHAGNATSTNGSIILQDQYTAGHLTNFGTNQSSGGPVIGYGVYPSSSANTFVSSTTISVPRSALIADSEFRWYTGGSQTVSIGSAATLSQKMVLNNNGNLGIDTTLPLAKLQVGISSALTNYQGAPLGLMLPDGGGSWIEFAENTTNGTSFRISHAGSSETIMMNTNVRAIGFRAAGYAIEAADAQMILTTAGNLGIGTTSPQKPLDVVSNANDFVTVGAATIGVGQWTGIHFGYRENNTSFRKSAIVFERTDLTASDAQGKIHILNGPQGSGGSATLSDAKITIIENGNVGIGLTSPLAKLHVDASNSAYIRGGDDHEFWDINVANTAGLYGVQNSAVGAIKLGSGGPTLHGSGSFLGIDTITPSAKLEINGAIKTAAPTGYTAKAWKLGDVATGTCVPSDFTSFGSWFTGTVISIEVDGVSYTIPAINPGYC
jgi:hypothetical protein